MNLTKQNLTDVAADSLQKILDASYPLLLASQISHWNVSGSNFYSLHQMFQTQYEIIWKNIDTTAEFILTLKQQPKIKTIHLDSFPYDSNGMIFSSNSLISKLIEMHKDFVDLVVNEIYTINSFKPIKNPSDEFEDVIDYEVSKNQDVVDYLSELLKTHKKFLWMLNSSL